MDIRTLIKSYLDEGYEQLDAESKVSQDIILSKISKTKFWGHITIKGGVVMHFVSNDLRRATRDLDLDFIKYSLEDNSIINFIDTLDKVNDDIRIKITGKIRTLHHQDYDGKRVNLEISDFYNNKLHTKLDIGVHKQFDIKQEEYCFNLNGMNENVNLIINSKEQIFTEKLKSLLKIGARSTRYKDLFDFYYLINNGNLNKKKLLKAIDVLIINDDSMRENNIEEIIKRITTIFNSNNYKRYLSSPKVNWLDITVDEAIDNVIKYLSELSKETIAV